jgi:large subunit ribosomal protein L31
MKKNLHPKWNVDAKVLCNGETVLTIGSTKSELNVDVWSGNHPFYTGSQKIIDAEGRVEKFNRKYKMKSNQPN